MNRMGCREPEDAGALEKAMRKMKPKGEMTKQILKGASHLRGSRGRHPRKRQQNHGGELVYSEVTDLYVGAGLVGDWTQSETNIPQSSSNLSLPGPPNTTCR